MNARHPASQLARHLAQLATRAANRSNRKSGKVMMFCKQRFASLLIIVRPADDAKEEWN